MKRNIGMFLASLIGIYCFVVQSYAETTRMVPMGMVTGGPKGTYYQFGLNLRQLVEQNGISLNVQNSNGSVENIYAVFKRPNTQMGIVQSDVLAFVAKVQSDPVLKKIAQKIKMVYPLYDEEIHLLGNNSITDFDDLAGRRVAVGKEGSGSFLTAKLLFEVSGVIPAEMVAVGGVEALKKLKKGAVDAMFYVAGYPVKLFKESVSEQDGLALLPIVNSKVMEFYGEAVIPGSTYTWQPDPVRSAAVKSVLVSYNFRMANCENVGKFARTVADNMDWLREKGHPKWNAVDLNYQLKGWEQYDCVQKYQVKKVGREELNPVLEAIKDIL